MIDWIKDAGCIFIIGIGTWCLLSSFLLFVFMAVGRLIGFFLNSKNNHGGKN